MIWDGVPFGFERDNERVPITHTGNAPVLVIGPPGSAKAVGFIVMLDMKKSQRSYLCIDPKGESAAPKRKRRKTT